jgi:hypothetical protein
MRFPLVTATHTFLQRIPWMCNGIWAMEHRDTKKIVLRLVRVLVDVWSILKRIENDDRSQWRFAIQRQQR